MAIALETSRRRRYQTGFATAIRGDNMSIAAGYDGIVELFVGAATNIARAHSVQRYADAKKFAGRIGIAALFATVVFAGVPGHTTSRLIGSCILCNSCGDCQCKNISC